MQLRAMSQDQTRSCCSKGTASVHGGARSIRELLGALKDAVLYTSG